MTALRTQPFFWLLAALLALAAGGARAESVESLVRKGNRLYEAGEFTEAAEAYRQALQKEPSPLVKYNLGTALARLRHYEDARQVLGEAAENASTRQRRDSHFNLGIVEAEPVIGQQADPARAEETMESLKRSLKHFREAILTDPQDLEAVYNYELVQRRLQQLEQQRGEQEQQQQQQGEGDQQQQQQQQGQGQGENQDQQQNQQSQPDQQQQGQQGQQNQQQQNQQNQGDSQDQRDQADQGERSEQDKAQQSERPGEPREQMSNQEMDALRLLNLLEQENPEQFRRIFQRRGGERRLEKDW